MLSLAKEEPMPKLTDSQLIVLSKAAGRDDGVAVVQRGMGKAAAGKIGSSLVARKLMREIGRMCLVITRAGRDTIRVEDGMNRLIVLLRRRRGSAPSQRRRRPRLLRSTRRRPGSKQALVIVMLSKEDGASLDALIK